MNALNDIFLVFIKAAMSYALYNCVLWASFSLDFAILVGTVSFLAFMVLRIQYNEIIASFFCALIFFWVMTFFVGLDPHSKVYFWVFGYDNVFLFE